jgi:hypothetical protein
MFSIPKKMRVASLGALPLLALLLLASIVLAVNPAVPPGIEDPEDVAYGKHSNFGIAKYDAETIDRIEWLKENACVPLGHSFYTPRGADPVAGTEVRLPVEVLFTDEKGVQFATTLYYVRYTPHVAMVGIRAIYCGEALPKLALYPGYDVRHPVAGDPVGQAWPEMEQRWRRKAGTLFHPSGDDSDQFKVGAEFKRANGETYVKRQIVIKQVAWEAQLGTVWERTR